MLNNRLDFLTLAKYAKERGHLTPALLRSYLNAYKRTALREKTAAQ